jgi:hypothetical protein
MGARYAWLRSNFICRRRPGLVGRWRGGGEDEERVVRILPWQPQPSAGWLVLCCQFIGEVWSRFEGKISCDVD